MRGEAGLRSSDIDEVFLVGGATRMPRVRQIVRDIFDKEPLGGVDPGEFGAVGAAIRGAALADEGGMAPPDITPLSIGPARPSDPHLRGQLMP